ncbi:MAG: helix-turn-helix transcriptional regulator [Bacteriovoracaceae bacterium]|nr:helix-turn-helix transcriptional regulator [Bacteriovoracaceae bacterium]
MKLKNEGTIIEEFVDFESKMGILYQKGGNDFVIKGCFQKPAILFSRCHSLIKLKLFNNNKLKKVIDTDIYYFITIPGNYSFEISSLSNIVHFVIFVPNKDLEMKTINEYNFSDNQFLNLFKNITIRDRGNWLNEIMHRYVFERVVAKKDDSNATRFLEMEILKEIYYSSECKNSSLKNRFNLNDLNFEKKSDVLGKALKFIENNLLEDLCMNDIIQEVGASESSILRVFKNELKISPFKYIKDRRLEESLFLLKQNKYAVSEVAYIIKYANPSSFVSSFKKKYKCSPLAYVRTKALESNPI